MGPELVLACLPHFVDVSKHGALDSAQPLVTPIVASAGPASGDHRSAHSYVASKAKLRFDFQLKAISARLAKLEFVIQKGSGKNWSMIGAGSQAVVMGDKNGKAGSAVIDASNEAVPALAVECAVSMAAPGGDKVETDLGLAKAVTDAPAAPTGAVAAKTAGPETPGTAVVK